MSFQLVRPILGKLVEHSAFQFVIGRTGGFLDFSAAPAEKIDQPFVVHVFDDVFFGELLGIRVVPLDVVVFFFVGYALSVVFEILLFLFQFGTLIYAQNVAFELLVDFCQSVRFALVDADGRLAALRGIAGRAVCRLRRR